MFSSLPMVAISRGLRKPRPTSMARSCFWLFADRLALSSGLWIACSSTPTHFPAHYASPVRKPVVRRVLMSRISQRSSDNQKSPVTTTIASRS